MIEIMIAVFTTLVFCLTGILLMMRKKDKQAQNNKEQKKIIMENVYSQINPHFLYNSLTAIRVLCVKDGEQAQKAIDVFSKYLRINMNLVKCEQSIPFENALEHTKLLLYLEKIRFGDEIDIVYDIRNKSFNISPIALQKLIFNAVEDGITKKENGGKIKISSYKKDNYNIVEIIDDGVGFDTNLSGNGIKDVGDSLKKLCRGKLKIESTIGCGTMCRIMIPVV